MSNNLLKEALADVESLTRAAEENAVHAVVEAVTPRIRSLIESKMIELDQKVQSPKQNKKVAVENVEHFSLDAAAIKKIAPLIESIETSDPLTIEFVIKGLSDKVNSLFNLKEGEERNYEQIDMAVSSVMNMYEYVRETVKDESERSLFETQLNKLYEKMKESIEELEMSTKLNEEDLTLKLSGLPELEDEDLENVEVELLADEGEEEGGEEEFDVDGGEGEGEEEFDLSGFGEESDEEEEDPFEENTVYEIDESLLATELKKMNEGAVDPSCLDDFGGGSDDGDPWQDSDLPDVPGTKDSGPRNVSEADGDDEDEDDSEDISEIEIKAKLKTEAKILKNVNRRLAAIKKQYNEATSSQSKKRLKEAYTRNKARLNESHKRVKILKESASHLNNGKGRSAENNSGLVISLRKKLTESNLNVNKLLQAVKVLQMRSLNNSQKKKILESLQKAKTLSEVKEVNARVAKVVKRGSGKSKSMNESRGSSSAPMRSTSSSNRDPLNESLGVARWQTLAGLDGGR